MQKALAYYQGAKSFEIKFKSKVYWASSDEWNETKGKLWLEGNDKFHLFLPEAEMVSDGKTYWKFSLANKQVALHHAEQSEASGGTARILFEFLHCEPLSLEKVKQQGTSLYHLTVKPSGSLKNYDSVGVYLKSADYSPFEMRTVDGGGNVSVYSVTKLKRDKKFKASHFQFSAPKGVEAVDLRD